MLTFNISGLIYLLKPFLFKLYNLQLKICSKAVLVKLYLPSQAIHLNLRCRNRKQDIFFTLILTSFMQLTREFPCCHVSSPVQVSGLVLITCMEGRKLDIILNHHTYLRLIQFMEGCSKHMHCVIYQSCFCLKFSFCHGLSFYKYNLGLSVSKLEVLIGRFDGQT